MMEEKISHRHFSDYAGHPWVCEGTVLRPGDTDGDHSACTVELIACPEHKPEQERQRAIAEQKIERRNAEFGLEEKWERMQAMPESPEKDPLAGEILNYILGIDPDSGSPEHGVTTHCQCGCADADHSNAVAWCLRCDHVYIIYSPEIEDLHFTNVCLDPRRH
jgi:hypothetical protein